VRRARPEYPSLVGVVYFNQKEVYPWPDDLGYPDWRVEFRVTE
jgi:endoglucanase